MSHGYETKRFPLTAAQGRVLYHMERILRSTGGGMKAHADYLTACFAHGLPEMLDQYTLAQCVDALRLLEHVARVHKLHLFRDVSTGWRDFLPSRTNVGRAVYGYLYFLDRHGVVIDVKALP
jgi:hypothetical protein